MSHFGNQVSLAPGTLVAKLNPSEWSGEHLQMPDWIAKANIEHFKKLLEREKDPQKRAVIERELAEEEAKLTALKKKHGEPKV